MAKPKIEAMLPLTPMQEALLLRYHARVGGADPGLLRLRGTLQGTFDPSVFVKAVERVTARHASLRASVHWERVPRPLQVVHRTATPDVETHDLRSLDAATAAARLSELIAADEVLEVDVRKAPVGKMTVISMPSGHHELLWTCHHLLLDGWSGAIVLDEIIKSYDALAQRRPIDLPTPRPFAEYVRWLSSRQEDDRQRFFSELLGEVDVPTPLPRSVHRPEARGAQGEARRALDESDTAALTKLARSHSVTLSTVLHAAWALTLSALSRRDDVVFGTAVSGRPAELEGVGNMVGLFTNTLPFRAALDPSQALRAWLKGLHRQQAEATAYQHASAAEIAELTGRRGKELYGSVLVVENYPWDPDSADGALSVEEFQGAVATTHALTLIASPGCRLEASLRFDRSAHDDASAEAIVGLFMDALRALSGADTVRDALPARPEFAIQVAEPSPEEMEPRDPGRPTRPPSNLTERRLAQIWRELLDGARFGVDDDFFDVGGDSLRAAHLFVAIEERFSKRLPVTTLLNANTIASLAALITGDAEPALPSSSVVLEASGSRDPLFIVHGLSGLVVASKQLIEHIDDRPLFGLQAPGVDDYRPEFSDLPELARQLVDQMIEVQPEGPYHLFGPCFGSLVFEMAGQLVARGAQVGLVAMTDSPPPEKSARRPSLYRAVEEVRMARKRLRRRVLDVQLKLRGEPPVGASRRANIQFRDHVRQVRHRHVHHGAPYRGRLVLIFSQEATRGREYSYFVRRWTELAEGVDLHVLPGGHDELAGGVGVQRLAALLQDYLTKLES